ncbi:coiled-coil domain-containing protein 39-like [Anoplophora glabripennis]|uniref:coiled-coil domain-containing protein 39-like n=1 Tax=Anoplophora glabripennis TaxID=217634 RepID=UPI00087416F0|nr:coiled-coil domain-containing protein 39-like [Anoplophora glabripennis]
MDLEEILTKLGWDDGFQIPIANAENKALEEQVARLSLRKTKANNELDRATSRLEGLKDHIKYVGQENDQNQKLITAQRQQLETAEHYYHLTKAEKTNVQNDLKRLMKELQELEQFQEGKKSDLQKNMAKAEKLKTETEWDAEALKAWEETLKKRDDDIELVKKFSTEDARKYNDLEARRQLLQVESDRKRKALLKIVAELRNNEMVIDRTGKALKQQEKERDDLVKRWKEAVKMLQRRDEDVVKTQEHIIGTQELIERHKEKLDEENVFLNNEKRNNHELDLEMESLNALNSRLRRDCDDLAQDLLTMNSELQALKREVASSAQQLENERLKRRFVADTIQQTESRCVKFEEDIEKLIQKLEEMKDSNTSSAEKLRNIEKMVDMEEKLYNIYVSDTEKINSQLYRSDKAYKDQITIGKSLEMEVSNTTLICTQLRKRIRCESTELEKFKEVVYNMEFRIDEFEKRLLALEYEAIEDDNAEEKEKAILELEETLTNHKAVQHTLQIQVDKLREEMGKLNTAMDMDKEQLAFLRDKCEQHLLENEISKKHIAAAKKVTQEKQVEENMMRLRINHIENDMKKEDKMIFNMEKLRLNLDQVMRERQLEINTNKMILLAKRRNLDEDRGRLKTEIALSRLKIEQHQKKYHMFLSSLGQDEDGQPISVTNFRIKYAQEKLILQEEGDLLDQKIKTAEKEIVAMENTLKIVNLTNVAFKRSLAPIKDDDQEVQEMKALEEDLNKTNNTLREYRKKLTRIKEELQALRNEIKVKNDLEERMKESVSQLEDEFDMIQKQEMDKAEKLKRAQAQIKKLLKKLGQRDISKYNRDFEIKLMKVGNKLVLQKLMEMCGLYPEIGPLVNRYISEHNISLPEKKVTWSSSNSSGRISHSSGSPKQPVTPISSSTSSEHNVKKVNLALNI